mmetsp:Transcript_15722/g.46641  ORF Transcript_15722/g.46641 Transcript_15722/m.46641 type:complete len:230 (+) Transcript_15722:651-1340(+)
MRAYSCGQSNKNLYILTMLTVPMPVENVVKFAAFIPVASRCITRRQSPPQNCPWVWSILCIRSTSQSPSKPNAFKIIVTFSNFLPLVKCIVCFEHRFSVSTTYSILPHATATKVTSPMPKRLFWMICTFILSALACTAQYVHGSPMPLNAYIGSNIFKTSRPGVGAGPWWTNQQGTRGLARFFRRVTMYTLLAPCSRDVLAFSTAKAPLPKMAVLDPSRCSYAQSSPMP